MFVKQAGTNSAIHFPIQRGERRGDRHEQAARQTQLTEEDFKRRHTKYRFSPSEQIERSVDGVAQHFPGCRKESPYGEVGWGAACWRDDFQIEAGKRATATVIRNQVARLVGLVKETNLRSRFGFVESIEGLRR